MERTGERAHEINSSSATTAGTSSAAPELLAKQTAVGYTRVDNSSELRYLTGAYRQDNGVKSTR